MPHRMPMIRGLGAMAMILGLLLTYNLFMPPQYRIFGRAGTYLMFFGPLILAGGVLKYVMAWHRKRKATDELNDSAASSTPASASTSARKTILCVGLCLIGIPALIWLAAPFAGKFNELMGFLGTAAFIFLGLPGIAITLFALFRKRI